ncbi:MAG: TRAP transporter small permease [Aminivibrio sp.]|jgi:TRAP-type C4-dicarboxylate transport system permease small subunit
MKSRLIHHIDRWEEYLLFTFMTLMLIVLSMQVFTRYVLGFSFSWAEQFARFGFVWLTMAGLSLAAKKGMHLNVDLLPQSLPKHLAKKVVFFANIFVVLFGLYMGHLIFKTVLMQIRLRQVFPSIPWLPVWTMYIAGVLGMLGLSFRTVQRMILERRRLSEQTEKAGE